MKKKLFKLATGLMLMIVMLFIILMCFPAHETRAAVELPIQVTT